MNYQSMERKQSSIGYYIGLFGVILILFWIGAYKFTPTEANLIKPLVDSNPLTSWLYSFLSIQTVSNIIGIVEIIVGIGLIIGIKSQKIGFYSGIAATIIFLTTLSFLITKSDLWKISDGILITNFFIVKDIVLLGISVMVIERNRPRR